MVSIIVWLIAAADKNILKKKPALKPAFLIFFLFIL